MEVITFQIKLTNFPYLLAALDVRVFHGLHHCLKRDISTILAHARVNQ